MELSASLRAVEAEIDGEYLSNSLLLKSRAQATWSLLNSVEEWSIAPLVTGKMRSVHDHASGVDNQINILKYALQWITKSCASVGKLVQVYEPISYKAAYELIKLAGQYYAFTAVFEYWHQNELQREIRDRRKEILKGISQLRLLSGAFRQRCPHLFKMLQLPFESALSTAVVSKEWIGDSVLQRQDTPVVMEHHFIAKLSTGQNLSEIASWLTTTAYLPKRAKTSKLKRELRLSANGARSGTT